MKVRGGVRTHGSAVVTRTSGLLVSLRLRLVSVHAPIFIARVVPGVVAELGVRVPVAETRETRRIVENPVVGLAQDELLQLGEFAVAGAVTQPVGVQLNERVPLLVGRAVALQPHRGSVQSGGHHLALFSPRTRRLLFSRRGGNRQHARPRASRLRWACETNEVELNSVDLTDRARRVGVDTRGSVYDPWSARWSRDVRVPSFFHHKTGVNDPLKLEKRTRKSYAFIVREQEPRYEKSCPDTLSNIEININAF